MQTYRFNNLIDTFIIKIGYDHLGEKCNFKNLTAFNKPIFYYQIIDSNSSFNNFKLLSKYYILVLININMNSITTYFIRY